MNFSLSKSKILNASEKLVFCPVCLDEIPFSKTLELSCKHRFCLECLSREWEYNIMNGYFSPERLKCPNEKCFVPITYYELRSTLKDEVFKKYENFSFQNFQTQIDSPEKTIICPNQNCQKKFFVNKSLSYFCCFNCKNKYCLDCLGDWKLHQGISCEDFKNKNLSKEEKEFREQIKKKKWMSCPECKTVVEKIEYCNFIRCASPICQKKTCFCYLCGKKLTQEEHFDHFKDKNPYGNVCINMNDIGDIKKTAISQGKCPKCNESSCEFLANFNNKICICRSTVCNGKTVCLKCRNYLNDKLLNKHLDQKDFDCTNLNSAGSCIIF